MIAGDRRRQVQPLGRDGAADRAGFVLFGLAVIWIGHLRRHEWRQPATAFHVTFGICMFGVAANSLRSWEPNATYDATEDLLHSIAATVMGFAFAFGVATAALRLKPEGVRFRFFDAVAVASSVILPISMSLNGSIDGALQRAMFFIAYLWYGREALLASSQPPVDADHVVARSAGSRQ